MRQSNRLRLVSQDAPNLRFAVLQSPADILSAKALVHDVYTNHLNWSVKKTNPSGLRESKDPSGRLFLEDDFDAQATWLGIWADARLIACLRILKPKDGRFEIQHYRNLPSFLAANEAAEVNRLAIDPAFIESGAFQLLLGATVEFCAHQGLKFIFSAVEFPQPGTILTMLGMKKTEDSEFRYSEADPNPVSLLFLDLSDPVENEKRKNMLMSLR